MKELYEYQKVALARVNEHLKKHDSALLVMASGLGKSVVAASWVKEQLANGRGLVLCHDSNILEQLISEFRESLEHVASFGMFNGSRKDTEAVDLLFATFQTLRTWKQVFFRDEFAFIVIDEAHHSEADTYRQVLEYLKPKKTLAMTATPDRMDGRDIRSLFGDEVVEICLEEAIVKGWLTPIEYRMVTDDLNDEVLKKILREIDAGSRSVSIKQLNETIFIRKRDEEIARIIMEYDKKTIVFCESIEHIKSFMVHLPDARCIHSKNSLKDNQDALDDFRDGKFNYILAVNQFNEGIDVPDAEVVAFLRCTNSQRIFIQQLGRGLRKSEGKDKVVVLDFVGNCDRVIAVQQMLTEIDSFVGRKKSRDSKMLYYVDGKGFKFIFSKEFRNIADVIRRVQTKLYISDIPHLLAEYDREKNPLPPEEVRAGTNEKIHWKCSKPECGHEWQASGKNRIDGCNCPACSNKVVTIKNCLATTHPELAKEFHPVKNLPLTIYNIVAGTNKKVWWLCSVCGYEWQATGDKRVRGCGCAACANQVVTEKNCLKTRRPDLAKEFHSTKNKPFSVTDFVASSHEKAWWFCSVCGHEWQAVIYSRFRGYGCPRCARKKIWETRRRNQALKKKDNSY